MFKKNLVISLILSCFLLNLNISLSYAASVPITKKNLTAALNNLKNFAILELDNINNNNCKVVV